MTLLEDVSARLFGTLLMVAMPCATRAGEAAKAGADKVPATTPRSGRSSRAHCQGLPPAAKQGGDYVDGPRFDPAC